jgi:hypothetical protein
MSIRSPQFTSAFAIRKANNRDGYTIFKIDGKPANDTQNGAVDDYINSEVSAGGHFDYRVFCLNDFDGYHHDALKERVDFYNVSHKRPLESAINSAIAWAVKNQKAFNKRAQELFVEANN